MALSTTPQSVAQPHLIRALGRRDLVLLFVVAVFNLNVVPSIAANGGVTVWLWIISLPLFFWPQGIAVIELAHRYPGEVDQQPGGDWNVYSGGRAHRARRDHLVAFRNNFDRSRFSRADKSQVRSKFFRSDLFWPGRP